ncbi:MAG TPA: photosystem reaction center subunit H [Cyanobacteria bacterium UBA8553]|nr:photosystem reaction center subunit H [Cyanobacteria bacterium UBA8553]HAJ62984.1 photosystem reaction center subunit H [Cyanobacteria bacterium UBA8543]
MILLKLADFYPNHKALLGEDDIKGYDVYAQTDEKIGDVYDVLVDESGRFRYFVIDTGLWIFGKKVLLPVGRARTDYDRHRVYATGMTKEQAENLPEYNENTTVDYDYEERVRNVYRPTATATATPTYDRNTYTYDRDRELYDTSSQEHQNLKLYEERLIANKNRQKTGEVAIGKRVETETATVSVPVEKERVVIERTNPTDTREVAPGEADFREGEAARMEVYEESADIQKKAVVREEVSVRKEVERDTVARTETVRREELDVDTDDNTVIDTNR